MVITLDPEDGETLREMISELCGGRITFNVWDEIRKYCEVWIRDGIDRARLDKATTGSY